MLVSVYEKNKNTVHERAELAVFDFKFLISLYVVRRETEMFVSSNQPLKIKKLTPLFKDTVSWTAAFPHSSSISVLLIEWYWPPLIIGHLWEKVQIDIFKNRLASANVKWKCVMCSSVKTLAEPSYEFFHRNVKLYKSLSFIIKDVYF